ncbi:MAG: hypothetical protein Q7T21_11440 [Gallionella sp.]|nr:hypothetical protein [Gallionella sp.]
MLLNATAIKDATGRFLMSRSMVFDITDSKRAPSKPYNFET